MRLWIFDFDVLRAAGAADRAATKLDPACEALLRRLADFSSDQVAIVSNRNIYDISGRINIPGVIIGGCNGIEWQLPSGFRIGPFRDHEDELIRSRINILPELSKLVAGKNIEVEDKLWSIAVHTRKPDTNAWSTIVKKITQWSIAYGLTVCSGSEQVDIQLIPGFNKSVGIGYLARMFNLDPISDAVVYAGGHESDVIALWWTKLFGGTALMVGNDLRISEAAYVQDSSALVSMIDNMLVNA